MREILLEPDPLQHATHAREQHQASDSDHRNYLLSAPATPGDETDIQLWLGPLLVFDPCVTQLRGITHVGFCDGPRRNFRIDDVRDKGYMNRQWNRP